MKNTLALAVVAGLATVASAQDFSLSIVDAPIQVDSTVNTTFTFDVIGDASVGTHILGGSFAVESNSGLVTNMSWDPADWSQFDTDNGYAGNGNYNQVIFGQLVIVGVPPFDVPGPGSELGGVIGTFTVDIAANSAGTIDFSLLAQSPFSLEVVDVNTGETAQSVDGNLSLNGASINVVPAPSAMALLGLGGLVAGRRRR